MVWRTARLASLGALLGVTACGALLGIEDVHEGPTPGGGAAGVTSGGAGGLSATGGNATPGGGSNPTGGHAGASEAGGPDTGGNGGDAEGGASGSAAGGAGGAGTTVQGHLIDLWGHRLPNVPVEVGGKQTTTDADGAFSIANAPAQYDASLVVSIDHNGTPYTRAWVFQGLTRRDPTLQIYEALPTKEGPVDILPNNPPALTDTRTLTVAMAGPDGDYVNADTSGAGLDGAFSQWVGPNTTQETAHALIWQNGADGLPDQFIAYDAELVGLSSTVTAHAKVSFDLTAKSIAKGTITGTVAGSDFSARSNDVFLRFTSNAVISLLSDAPTTAGFSYTVPGGLAGASVIFAAANGDFHDSFAIAHKDGLLAGASQINLSIPTPAKALAATGDLNAINAATKFSFTAGSAGPFVGVFTNDGTDDQLYVVTSKVPFTFPSVVGGKYKLKPGAFYNLRIETHGTAASVDAMAGPTGFIDSFAVIDSHDAPTGPRTGDGSYTISSSLALKAAP